MSDHRSLGTARGSLRTYATGFALSILLTIVPFAIVINHWIHGRALIFTLAGFAILQLLVQLQFFIHLGHESKPRWNLQMFLCALLVVIILVGGTLWIMDNLNYHIMSPSETSDYVQQEERIER